MVRQVWRNNWTGVRRLASLILVIAIAGGSTTVHAQAPLQASAAMTPAATDASPTSAVRLLVGRSTVLDVGSPIARVSLTSADVADAMVTSPNQLLINGKVPGTISMFVWDRGGALRKYEVNVQRDLSRLSEQMKTLFPGEQITVQSSGKNIILTGTASNKDVIEKAVNVAAGYVASRDEVTTLLQIAPDGPSNQVLLRVRFAEVSRSALTELGASLFTSPTGVESTLVRTTTQQFAAPGFSSLEWTKASGDFGADVTSAKGEFTFSDFLNFFLFSQKYDLGMMVRALQQRGLFQSLAEPNLVAESGKEASFLAGGEFPIPIVQGNGNNTGISVMFKEFGIRLNFTPTVNGNRVRLKVRPEVSTLDFGNAVVLQGFRIPALQTRRTETELELENGQTFAIAGLMNNTVASTMQKIPGIGDIPILGYLFRSKAAQKNQTELVVMITPQILANNSSGVTTQQPVTPEPYMPPVPTQRSAPALPPAFTPERSSLNGGQPVPATAVARPVAQPASPSQDAAAAAATVSALTPSAPRMNTTPAATSSPAVSPVPAAAAAPAPAAPAATTPVATVAPATRPLTPEEMKVIERARKAEEERARKDAQLRAREQAEQDAIARRQAEEDRKIQEKAAREQAKRDAEELKRAQEEARRQAERDRERQKQIEAAAARLKAAEAEYNAEVAKQQGRQ